MNVILYTQDFEPITVVDLPHWLLEAVEREGAVKVAVKRPITTRLYRAGGSWLS